MDYTTFQMKLADEVRRILGEGCQVSVRPIEKNNGIRMQGMVIRGRERRVSPIIYLEDYFDRFLAGEEWESLAEDLVACYREGAREIRIADRILGCYEGVAHEIYCKLIGVRGNEERLKDMPHRLWQDLAVVFYYSLRTEDGGEGAAEIRWAHLRNWGISGDRLSEDAWRNTCSKRKAVFCSLEEALLGLKAEAGEQGSGSGRAERSGRIRKSRGTEAGGSDPDVLDWGEAEGEGKEEGCDQLFLLTNDRKIYGSIMVCREDILKKIGEKVGGNYYILPSSIHECLILPDRGDCRAEDLNRMIREINRSQVSPLEILSDHAYYYDREEARVRPCAEEKQD